LESVGNQVQRHLLTIARDLDRLMVDYGKPKTIVSDNAPSRPRTPSCDGKTTKRSSGITSRCKPVQNAFAESFIDRLRDELL
jgi:putative transposase